MDISLQSVEWVPVLVSFVAAFGLGWLWYSPVLFVKRWAGDIGLNLEDKSGPMLKAMLAQAVSTFLFAAVINLALVEDNLLLAILVTITIAGFVKANGLFKLMSTYVVAVESGCVIAMGAVMILINLWL